MKFSKLDSKPLTTSDNTKIYDFKNAEKIFSDLKIKEFSRGDLILIILAAREQPIHGRILLMKEMFLLYQKLLKPKTEDPKFVPYRFGPYSFHLTELIHILNIEGLLEIKGRRNSNSESFKLTTKGRKEGKKVLKKLDKSEQKQIIENRKGWDQLGTAGILNYVYIRYPDYKVKSFSKNRYKDVIWGQ